MVTKTETCAFTEYRIYPGAGKKFVAKDGKTFFFINNKAAAFHHKKTKPVNLTWTTAWRRFHKNITNIVKTKRRRRVVKQEKAIVGMNLDEIKRRKDAKSDFRQKLREQARKEVQDRKKKEIDARKANKKAQGKGNVPKNQKNAGKAPKGQKMRR